MYVYVYVSLSIYIYSVNENRETRLHKNNTTHNKHTDKPTQDERRCT